MFMQLLFCRQSANAPLWWWSMPLHLGWVAAAGRTDLRFAPIQSGFDQAEAGSAD
jgi:hypothetical protein